MRVVNAQDLINQMLLKQEPASPEKNLFLSCFTLKGETDLMVGEIQNIFIRPGFTLNITQMVFKEDVEMVTPFPAHLVGFTFCLKGESTFVPPQEPNPLVFKDGLSTFYKTTPHEGRAQFKKGTDYISIAIHLEAPYFKEVIGNQFSSLPHEFQDALSTENGHRMYVQSFDSRIRLLLEELSEQEFNGLSKQFFIEGKVLEIMGLTLDAVTSSKTESRLTENEEEKIRACEALLRAQYNQPLSLLQLAREVGLNDFKLKQGFKATYGRPVFKYLQEYRLKKAKESLEREQLTVSEVAENIGYNSLGSFSNAFMNQFGIRPNEVKSVSDKN